MKTLVQPPVDNEIGQDTLTGTVAAGAFIDLPAAHGVAVYPEGGVSGDLVSIYYGGIYRVVKAGADGAWVPGTVLYLDDAAQEFTLTAGAHQIAGFAAAPATAAAVEGHVKLIPQVS